MLRESLLDAVFAAHVDDNGEMFAELMVLYLRLIHNGDMKKVTQEILSWRRNDQTRID